METLIPAVYFIFFLRAGEVKVLLLFATYAVALLQAASAA